MSTRPSFRQIASPLDVSDEALDKLNEDLGVPSLVNPAAGKAAAGPNLTQDASKPASRPFPARKPEKRISESPKPKRALREVRMAVDVPQYLRDAVNVRAATERCTARHIVMQGLLALGFEIESADLIVDGRQQSTRR